MEKKRLVEILEKFKDIKIAVVGDMMLDHYIIGSVDRISPEAPVPVVKVTKERSVLGGAANVVNNLAALGVKTLSLGVIGKDDKGTQLLESFKERGIETVGIIRSSERPTIVKSRVIAGHQQLLRIDWEDSSRITRECEDLIIENIEKNIKSLNAIILSDYDKGVLTPRVAKEIIRIANANGVIVTVDPKPKNIMNYVGATSVTPNRKEAIECLGDHSIKEIHSIGRALKEKVELKNLLLTRSEEGMSLFEEEKVTDIPTFAKEVYDVTGAGDTVISVYTLAAAAGAEFTDAAKIANVAAGVVVGRVGTSTVNQKEILEFYDEVYHEWE